MADATQQTLADKNKLYWNSASQNVFKDQWVIDLQNRIASYLTSPEGVAWLGLPRVATESPNNATQTKLLDYACGNGIISQTLKPHVSRCIGIDLSSGMLAKYNNVAREHGLPPDQMQGYVGDLLSEEVKPTEPELSEKDLNNFDIVGLSMALHHMEDVQQTVSRLAQRLRPGGVILIIDWASESKLLSEHYAKWQRGEVEVKRTETNGQHEHHHHHNHGHANGHGSNPIDPKHSAAHTISHDSFNEADMLSFFKNAGCVDGSYVMADGLSDVPGARTGKMHLYWSRAFKAGGPHGQSKV